MKNILLFVLLSFVYILPAFAQTDFNQESFKQAQKEGKSIILNFHADWCPTCRKQNKVITEILRSADFSKVVWFKVDFDNSESLQKELNVSRQSTLIFYKGESEVNRSIGETQKDRLLEETKSAL